MTDPLPPTYPALEPDDDLAANRPGVGLRAKSAEIRAAHPFWTLVGRILGVHNNERAWRSGAEGEEEVAWKLRKLGDRWRVLHGVPVGSADSDIDHVVIGPAGVFTLNTKNHQGARVRVYDKTIYVNGTQQPYIRNSRFEGTRASKLLTSACGFSVDARPVIVLMARELTFKGHPEGVHIVGRKKVADWLLSLPILLPPEAVETIYGYARRRQTWQPGSSVTGT